jgi:3-dehydroquinate synthase
MKHLYVEGHSGKSIIAVGESLDNLPAYMGGARGIIVTDNIVKGLYGHRFPPLPIIEIGQGEESKTLDTVRDIYEFFMNHEVDRTCRIVAIGGGIVCDVAGFAASTYLRGLSFGFVATTLLAQVDASVGGKNGVNLQGYKNLIGTFTQPDFVICDRDALSTLPERELINGFAEVIKQAAIYDGELFEFLEEHYEDALGLDPIVMKRVVHDSLKVKTAIVSRDEREKGERRKLNFGHTVGHAIEKVLHVKHGEAVSLGMMVAGHLSVSKGLLDEEGLARLKGILGSFRLPVEMRIDKALVTDALKKDKKRENDLIHMVLLEGIGHSKIVPMAIGEIAEAIDDMRKHS